MFWLIIIAIVAILYLILIRPHNYWTRRGVPQGNPALILGDTWGVILRKQSPAEVIQMVYNYNKNTRYIGMYQFWEPVLMIRDPELAKQISVKDFEYFLNHRGLAAADGDPLCGKNLFSLKDAKWREMRSTLSPAFTNVKMKYMFSLMSQSGEALVKHLKQNENMITIEMKDLGSKFANDVIASTMFGLKCDSFQDPENDFFVMAKDAMDFTSIRKILVLAGYAVIPTLLTFFKVTIFPEKINTYFHKIIKENIESREQNGVVRPDMISLLLEARKNRLQHEEASTLPDTGFATVQESKLGKNEKFRKSKLTHEDIAAQAFIFFLAGLDSGSSLISFLAQELGVNQNIQKKLRLEVVEVAERCDGSITYEALTTMKYLDMVVSETLRKFPTSMVTERVCTKPYTIEPTTPNEKPIHLKKNDLLYIATYAIQRDPKYFPRPEKFDPERFNDANKSKITPYTYMPFGTGPRNCIGSRFALLQIKIFFFYLLCNFEIVPVEKTQIPMRLNRRAINMTAEGGVWLGLQPRIK